MLEWLKGILGDAYTEEIDKAVAAEIGKAFVAKADFDAKNTELKAAKAQLADAGATIEGLRAEGKDLETLRREAEEYKARAAKAEQDAAAQLEDYKFNSWFDGLVTKHKGRDVAVIRPLAGEEKLAALRESEFQSTLPLRGATGSDPCTGGRVLYFNPRSRGGSDSRRRAPIRTPAYFNPRSP